MDNYVDDNKKHVLADKINEHDETSVGESLDAADKINGHDKTSVAESLDAADKINEHIKTSIAESLDATDKINEHVKTSVSESLDATDKINEHVKTSVSESLDATDKINEHVKTSVSESLDATDKINEHVKTSVSESLDATDKINEHVKTSVSESLDATDKINEHDKTSVAESLDADNNTNNPLQQTIDSLTDYFTNNLMNKSNHTKSNDNQNNKDVCISKSNETEIIADQKAIQDLINKFFEKIYDDKISFENDGYQKIFDCFKEKIIEFSKTNIREFIIEIAYYFKSLLEDPKIPEKPTFIQKEPNLNYIAEVIDSFREILGGMAKGDFSYPVQGRGFLSGSLKALIASLRHLVWQTRQVAEGDFSQRVQFLGDFSASFNQMTRQLEATLKKLKENEQALVKKNRELSAEIQYRIRIEDALRESERNYQQISTQDPLTGAFNRRYFWHVGEQELRRSARTGAPLCLLMLDIDFFKNVNDTYGHVIGDAVLIKFTNFLLSQLRSSDVVVRYGGEEFLVVLPDTSLVLACDLAERLRLNLSSSVFDISTGEIISITASMGVSLVEKKGDERAQVALERAINQADEALYVAKNTGRNKICCQGFL